MSEINKYADMPLDYIDYVVGYPNLSSFEVLKIKGVIDDISAQYKNDTDLGKALTGAFKAHWIVKQLNEQKSTEKQTLAVFSKINLYSRIVDYIIDNSKRLLKNKKVVLLYPKK